MRQIRSITSLRLLSAALVALAVSQVARAQSPSHPFAVPDGTDAAFVENFDQTTGDPIFTVYGGENLPDGYDTINSVLYDDNGNIVANCYTLSMPPGNAPLQTIPPNPEVI